MVRAKFVVDRVVREVRGAQAETQTVVMRSVRGAGEIKLAVNQTDVADQFVLGQTYSVDFTRDS